MSICLRPHHGMCFQFYEGKGYSEDFTDHMGRVIRECEEAPDQLITLTCSTDVVCKTALIMKAAFALQKRKYKDMIKKSLKHADLRMEQRFPIRSF